MSETSSPAPWWFVYIPGWAFRVFSCWNRRCSEVGNDLKLFLKRLSPLHSCLSLSGTARMLDLLNSFSAFLSWSSFFSLFIGISLSFICEFSCRAFHFSSHVFEFPRAHLLYSRCHFYKGRDSALCWSLWHPQHPGSPSVTERCSVSRLRISEGRSTGREHSHHHEKCQECVEGLLSLKEAPVIRQ